MELARLVLDYSVPAAIVAVICAFTTNLFPNDGSGGGGSLSAIGQIIATVGTVFAVGVAFYFHFRTRRW
ncbi:hypothetical protein D3227_33085 [Mesorhizobium waimense]|uniref:Uncharacterized protein n=1 Tax=Mesorhizobium waimense TaxID=1300307 RepID=A0A3A5K0T3_9HYPH|nr:hypothetical protein D3227_33085 [Mesorhizobium waimense]